MRILIEYGYQKVMSEPVTTDIGNAITAMLNCFPVEEHGTYSEKKTYTREKKEIIGVNLVQDNALVDPPTTEQEAGIA